MTTSTEDYLRVLYSLYEKQKGNLHGIKSIEVVNEMNLSKPSVSSMLKKLAKQGYLRLRPYGKIFFTIKGLKKAAKIMHNHRLIEVFLTDVLCYKIDHVHEEAHRLEHAFSEESIKRLDRFLNNPVLSPFGKRIPHEDMK